MKSRREFLRLVAVGSAAAMTHGARGAAAAAKSATAPAAKKSGAGDTKGSVAKGEIISAATRAEIEKQIKSTKDALKTIRDYPLPAGSPVAFVFRPLKPSRSGGR
ncbi:MAG: hypothetical protein HYR73_06205 [Candidatus Eisenbacteria bacterium]|nr:hypothetical protein [Candidatus Eisenbacteria bacterium]